MYRSRTETGKYTGEVRQELMTQCNAQVCDWALSYGKLVQTCPNCPKDCKEKMDEEVCVPDERSKRPLVRSALRHSTLEALRSCGSGCATTPCSLCTASKPERPSARRTGRNAAHSSL